MQKILSISAVLGVLCGAAYGATTCIHNQTPVFIIKKSVDPTSVSSDADSMTFSLRFDYDLVPNNSSYRTLDGMATCNEISTDTAGDNVVLGAANTHLRASNADVGTMCWCQLTGPITSWWVYLRQYSDDASCASSCARDCASAIRENTDNFRTNGVYLAIW